MKKSILFIIATIILFCTVLIHGASSPYRVFEEASEETVSSFKLSSFYSDSPSGESASVIVTNEDALAVRMQLVNSAKERIVLSTFELKSDEGSRPFLAALMMAARRGVKVYIVSDGAYPFYPDDVACMAALALEENLSIKVYNPRNVLMPEKWMPSLHDKYLLVDSRTYLAGGRNTTGQFLGKSGGRDKYIDWEVLVEAAPGVPSPTIGQLETYFEAVWADDDSKDRFNGLLLRPFAKADAARLERLWEEGKETHPEWYEPVSQERFCPVNHITLLANPLNTTRKEPVLFTQLSMLMEQAEGDLVFHTPYIVLNDYMTERLEAIAQSGKSVTAMVNTPPNSDNQLCTADYIMNKGSILATGLRIIEFGEGTPYHGKCFTLGDRLSGIGSFNWDIRSAYIDTELMVIIDSPELNRELRSAMACYEEKSIEVLPDGSYLLKEGQEEPKLEGKRKLLLKPYMLFDSAFHYVL